MRVLQIAFNDLGNGGVQRQIMAITRQLHGKAEIDVVVWRERPAYFDEEFLQYGRIIRCPHYNGKHWLRGKIDFFIRYPKIYHDILRVIEEYGPYDVVHSHKLFESAPCLAAAKKAGVPIRIAHAHITANPVLKMTPVRYVIKLYNDVYRKLIRKYATDMVGCSRAAADYVFGKNVGKVLHIAVNTERFRPDEGLSGDASVYRILNVGTYSLHKNQLFLINVFAELRKLRDDVQLVLVGKGDPYKREMLEKIREKHLEDHVILLPHDSDIPMEMNKADVFALPSNFEGLPLVSIEAQSIGLPCFISTAVTREADCGNCTFLDLSSGPQKWAEAIDDCLNANGHRKHPCDVSEFSEERMAGRVYKLYCGESYD